MLRHYRAVHVIVPTQQRVHSHARTTHTQREAVSLVLVCR